MLTIALVVVLVLIVAAMLYWMSFPASTPGHTDRRHIFLVVVVIFLTFFVMMLPPVRNVTDRLYTALRRIDTAIDDQTNNAAAPTATNVVQPASTQPMVMIPDVKLITVSPTKDSISLPTAPSGHSWAIRLPGGSKNLVPDGTYPLPCGVKPEDVEVYFVRISDNATSAAVHVN